MTSLAVLPACDTTVTPQAPIPPETPPVAPTPTPTPPATPAPAPTPPRPTSEMPLSVTLHHIGLRSNQAGMDSADIYFLAVITDGYEKASQRFLPSDGDYQLNGYQTITLEQELFHTESAGDSLKLCLLAYKRNDPQWQSTILIPALEEIERGLAWGDYRSAQEILTTVAKHEEQSDISFAGGGDSLIGYFEDVWGSNESLGIGQYEGVGTDDFRVWFSIWSTGNPEAPPAPTLLPDVELENINIVATSSLGQNRVDIVRIHNKEQHPITVSLRGTSLLAGEFGNEEIELEAKGYAWVENNVANPVPGVDTVTYGVYFRDTLLDDDSADLRVIMDIREITLVEWRNSDASVRIDKNTLDGTPVTLYVEAPGYAGVPFTASIRRVEPDGTYRYEENLRIMIMNGRGVGHWKAKWQEVFEGDPTYVFGVKGFYSNELTVVKKYEQPPDIVIEGVDMVSFIEPGQERMDEVTIRNNEEETVVVRLRGRSSLDGEFYNSALSVPGEGTTVVEIPATLETSGLRKITYQLYFQGIDFATWSDLLEVF